MPKHCANIYEEGRKDNKHNSSSYQTTKAIDVTRSRGDEITASLF
jgi:hypothetical protein